MLTITDVPEDMLEFYKQNKIGLSRIVNSIPERETAAIDSESDLCEKFPGSIAYVRSGIFRYLCDGRFVRFYSTGDIVTVPEKDTANIKIMNEFGAEVLVIKKTVFFACLARDGDFLKDWFNYQQASDLIMHRLCALYVGDDFKPQSDIRQYESGAVVIKEGDDPDYMYEMLEGSASVTVHGTEIGAVGEDEVFGEMSFLTGSRRGATVTTTSRCLIQLISGPDLEKLSKYRPNLILRLAQILAQRLQEVNKRLVSLSSMT